MPMVDSISLLSLLSHQPRAMSSSGSGFGEMGCSSYLTEKRAGPQSQFQMLWTALSQQGQRQTLEPAQAYRESSIAACVDDSLGATLSISA